MAPPPNEEIPAVEPLGAEQPPHPVDPVRPVAPARPAAPAAATDASGVEDGGDVELGKALQRDGVLGAHPTVPAGVNHHAAVHEAAMHGDPLAQAIEDAEAPPLPLDARARQLAGASAAAGLGTAAKIDRERYRDVDAPEEEIDPAAGSSGMRRVQSVMDDPAGDGDDHSGSRRRRK